VAIYEIPLAARILFIVWAFRARLALQAYALTEFKIDLRIDIFYTFLFDVFYIAYCINDLPEVYRKQLIVSGRAGQTTDPVNSGVMS